MARDSYYVDADHIGLDNVDLFMNSSDFFTLDVADFIGKPSTDENIADFVAKNSKYIGTLTIPGIEETFEVTEELIVGYAEKYLFAIDEAAKIYKKNCN